MKFSNRVWLSPALLLSFAVSAAPARAEDPDHARQKHEAMELAHQQAEMSRAFTKFYEGVREQKDPSQLADQLLVPADAKIGMTLTERRNTNLKMVYGRAYLGDGTNMDQQEFERNQDKIMADLKSRQESKGSPSAKKTVAPASLQTRGASEDEPSVQQPEEVIDGSGIQRNIRYSGDKKKKNKKKAFAPDQWWETPSGN